jgi:hypothetical protein
MIADFNAAPVSADELEPLQGAVLSPGSTGEVIMWFDGGVAGLFDRARVAQDNQGSGEGEIGFQGFNGEGMQGAGFNASVSGLGVGKKGVSFSASQA